MSGSPRPDGLLLAYYGDDFTGSTDAMEAISAAGVRTVLFLDTPTPALLDRFPDARSMQLAGRAILRDSSNAVEFGALLGDANEVIRYWAAQGLLMLKAGATPAAASAPAPTSARAALQTCFENDSSISVRIVAAEILAFLGPAEAPVRYLGELVGSPSNVRIRLQALNALTFIGEPARQVLSEIKAAVRDNDTYVATAARYLSLVLEGTYTPASQIYVGPAARES
jgi:hypothetical protein